MSSTDPQDESVFIANHTGPSTMDTDDDCIIIACIIIAW